MGVESEEKEAMEVMEEQEGSASCNPKRKSGGDEGECSRAPKRKRLGKASQKKKDPPRRSRKRKATTPKNDEESEPLFSEGDESDREAALYMTKEDKEIRELDVPERLQGLGNLLSVWPKNGDDVNEAEWIYSKMFGVSEHKAEIVKEIVNVLEHLLVSKFEVPYIGGYCKDECKHLSETPYEHDMRPKLQRFKNLWDVLYWHKKWVRLQLRRNKSRAVFLNHVAKNDSETRILKMLLDSLDVTDSEEAIDDVDAAFSFFVAASDTGGYKRLNRSPHSVLKNAGIVNIFGLDSYQFAENFQATEKKHEVQDPVSSPEDVAVPLVGPKFKDAISVLAAARQMVATEISMEPIVRQGIRKYYLENATITTRPTLSGINSDAFNEYAVKWLTEKPLDKFDDARWLLVEQAEKEGHLTVAVNVPNDIMQSMEAAYISEGTSDLNRLWNEQRKLILEEVLKILNHRVEKEVRIILANKARRWIASQCEDQLWKLVSTAPYYNGDETVARVAACCWGSGKSSTTFVALDSYGSSVDTFNTRYLNYKSYTNEQQQRQEEAIGRLAKFMEKNRPNVMVVEACNTKCRHLYDMIKEAVARIHDQSIDVVYGNAELATALESSSDLFPGADTNILRRAISLGRYIQNPLAAISWIFSSTDRLPIKLHPLQGFLPQEESYEVVERVIVTAASQVGLDVNFAAAHEWHFGPLQYLPGMGPRMARYIRRILQGFGWLKSRAELIQDELVANKVYINAAAFLRIRGTGMALPGSTSRLDDTRIHPDCYEIAQTIAADACSTEMDDGGSVDRVRQDIPDILRDFDIDVEKYHRMLTGGRGIQTLQVIKAGLLHGYVDIRSRFEPPTDEEVFFWLTKESPDILGKTATVLVRNVMPKGAMCLLLSGTVGMLPNDKLPPGVGEGSSLKCFVTGINFEFANLELTIPEGDEQQEMQVDDKYYKPDEAYNAVLKEETRKKQEEDEAKKVVLHRPINHQFFKNMSKAEAIQVLAKQDVGSFLFLPSLKGPSFLLFLLKLGDETYVQEDVLEVRKDSKDAAGILQLGKVLRISDQIFGSLDEIATGFVEPFMNKFRTMMQYKKFKDGTKQEVEEQLRAEKSENPRHVPYYFSPRGDTPGTLVLAYLTCIRLHEELVTISHKGYIFRGRIFDSPEKLTSFFKMNMEKIPEPKGLPSGGGGGRACHNCGETGHMSRECPTKGSGGGGACHKCGEEGHISRECPSGGGGGPRTCHKCGEEGHISRECPSGGGGGPQTCHKCGEEGHISRECPSGGGGGPRTCHKCGEEGHISRECPSGGGGGGGSRTCHKCGEEGHISRECPSGGGGGPRTCHKCGEEGHISRECPSGGDGGPRTCHNCGEEGHISRECPTKGSGGGGGSRACYNCVEEGHLSRDCPTKGSGGGSNRACYKCGEQGHMSRECPGGNAPATSNIDWGNNNAGADAGGDEGWGSNPGDGGWGSGAGDKKDGDVGWGTGTSDKKDAAEDGWGNTSGGDGDGGWGTGTKSPEQEDGAGWGSGSKNADQEGDAAAAEWGNNTNAVEEWKNSENRNRGGGGDRACYSCGENGHLSRDCPSKGSGGGTGGGDRACYSCGENGHLSRDCPSKGSGGGTGGGDRACYSCGENGHISRDCPSKGSGRRTGGGGSCYTCGEEGHMSRDCPTKKRGCFSCGEDGHMSRDCPTKTSRDGGWKTDVPVNQTNDNDGNTGNDDGWGNADAGGDAAWGSSDKGKALADGEDGWGSRDKGKALAVDDDGWGSRDKGKALADDEDGWGSSDKAPADGWGNTSFEDASGWGNAEKGKAPMTDSQEGGWVNPTANDGWGASSSHAAENNAQSEWGITANKVDEDNRRNNFGGGDGDNSNRRGACYSCGEQGHNSRDCPSKPKGGGACYSCGEQGHNSRDCPSKPKGAGACYSCGEQGHNSRDCLNKPKKPSTCFSCGQEGHMSRECLTRIPTCYYCDKDGHSARECPQRIAPGRPCYHCRQTGHRTRDCPARPPRVDPTAEKGTEIQAEKPVETIAGDEAGNVAVAAERETEKETEAEAGN